MKLEKLSKYSPIFLRTGIAIVFLWFGFSQLKDPTGWFRVIPAYATSLTHLSQTVIIYLNCTFEIVFATLLLIGFFTRTSSFLLFLHIIHITVSLGYGPVGVRDFSLAIATLAIFLHGADEFCIDKLRRRKK